MSKVFIFFLTKFLNELNHLLQLRRILLPMLPFVETVDGLRTEVANVAIDLLSSTKFEEIMAEEENLDIIAVTEGNSQI